MRVDSDAKDLTEDSVGVVFVGLDLRGVRLAGGSGRWGGVSVCLLALAFVGCTWGGWSAVYCGHAQLCEGVGGGAVLGGRVGFGGCDVDFGLWLGF